MYVDVKISSVTGRVLLTYLKKHGIPRSLTHRATAKSPFRLQGILQSAPQSLTIMPTTERLPTTERKT